MVPPLLAWLTKGNLTWILPSRQTYPNPTDLEKRPPAASQCQEAAGREAGPSTLQRKCPRPCKQSGKSGKQSPRG